MAVTETELRDKSYFCRTCGAKKQSKRVPPNWWSLVRYATDVDERSGKRRMVGMGLYCSLKCLQDEVFGLDEAER